MVKYLGFQLNHESGWLKVRLANLSRPVERLAEPFAVPQAHKKRNRSRVRGKVIDNLSEPVSRFRVSPQTMVEGGESSQDLLVVRPVSVLKRIEERDLCSFGVTVDVIEYSL